MKANSSRINFYIVRTIVDSYAAIVGLLILFQRNINPLSIEATCFYCVLIWPHIAYFYAKGKCNVGKIENNNRLVDSFFVGWGSSAVSFTILPTVITLSLSIFNNFSGGGFKQFIKGIFSTIAGCILGIYLYGLNYIPDLDILPTFLLFLYFILFTIIAGGYVHSQMISMIEMKRIVQHSNLELTAERRLLQSKNDIIERDIALAREIQKHILPHNSPLSIISSKYHPMLDVGGDFYDFILIPNSNKIGIFLSDVSGHGVPAAFITSMIKTTLLQAGEKIIDPASLLLYINSVLHGQLAGNFITAFYGIFETTTGTFLYSNAGHPQPYVISSKSVTQLQGGRNTALAMFPNNMLKNSNKSYLNYREILPSGSKILLYTDGLTETRPINDKDKYFEYSGMIDVFMEISSLPCDDFIDELFNRLYNFRGVSTFEDDVCLICVDVQY